MSRRVIAAFAGAVLALTACAGSDDGADVPATVSPSPDGAADTEPADASPDGTDTVAPTDTVEATDPAVTTTLVPAADADLPTEVPSAETAPPTTVAGPLPEPSVNFIEVASFDEPVDLATKRLDPRLVVVQQGGRIVAADAESEQVVLDIDDLDAVELGTGGGEQGLLGLAFHPSLDLAYVNFTDGSGNTVIAEFVVDPTTLQFDPASYREVLTIEQPYSNHNAGDLEFGPDGLLYIPTGDGGSGGDPERTALDLTSRLGKLLRIDPTVGADGEPFTVPPDNPFLGADDADPTIWAYGLRNPWKISFDPLTADLWVADVGQGEFEEISLAPADGGVDAGRGLSFGWSAFEGDSRFNDDQPADGHLPPVVVYPHEDGACSVSGGVVARNSSFGELNGWYVYGDFCSGQLWALDTTSVGISDSTVVGTPRIVEVGNIPALAAVREGPDGDIYAVSRLGPLLRLAPA